MCCSESYQIVIIFWLHCIMQAPFEVPNTSRATLVVPMKSFLVDMVLQIKS